MVELPAAACTTALSTVITKGATASPEHTAAPISTAASAYAGMAAFSAAERGGAALPPPIDDGFCRSLGWCATMRAARKRTARWRRNAGDADGGYPSTFAVNWVSLDAFTQGVSEPGHHETSGGRFRAYEQPAPRPRADWLRWQQHAGFDAHPHVRAAAGDAWPLGWPANASWCGARVRTVCQLRCAVKTSRVTAC